MKEKWVDKWIGRMLDTERTLCMKIQKFKWLQERFQGNYFE